MGRAPKPESLQGAYDKGFEAGYKQAAMEAKKLLEQNFMKRQTVLRLESYEDGYRDGIQQTLITAKNLLDLPDGDIPTP